MKRTLLLRSLAVAGLALGVVGCMKKSPTMSRPGADYGGAPESYEEADYDDYAMGDAEAMPEPEPMPAEDAEATAIEASPGIGDRIRTRRAAKREMASPSAPAASSGSEPPPPAVEAPAEGADGAPTKAIEDDTDAVANRHIVYTAQMRVSVFNLETAVEKAEALPDTYGGYIQTMGETRIVLRIPSKNLRKLMEDIGTYGVVERRSLQAQDVTAEFTDIVSRIRPLTETQTQLLELLDEQFEPILNPTRAHLYRVIMSELCLRNCAPEGRDRSQAAGLARWLKASGVTKKTGKQLKEAAELFYGTLYGDLFFPVMLGIERSPTTRARRHRLRQAIAFLFSALKDTL